MFDREEVEAYRAIPDANPIPDDHCGCSLCQAAAQFDAEDAAERQQDMDDLQQWMGVMGGDFVDYADLRRPTGGSPGGDGDRHHHALRDRRPPTGGDVRTQLSRTHPITWRTF
jgi:hypothetical protein